jgi:hypothetical protein
MLYTFIKTDSSAAALYIHATSDETLILITINVREKGPTLVQTTPNEVPTSNLTNPILK